MNRRGYELSFAHGPISGPINGALAAVILALLGRTHLIPAWAPLALAVGASAAVWVVGQKRRTPVPNVWFRIVCWTFAAGWATWVLWRGWSGTVVVVLILVTIVAGLIVPAFAFSEEERVQPARAARPLPAVPRRGVEGIWTDLIRNVCGIKEQFTVVKIRDWPRGAGFDLEVEWPAGSRHTWATLKNVQMELAAAARLAPGCTVTAEPSPRHQGATLLHVSTVNNLANTVDFGSDYSSRSIRDEFPIGQYADGEPALIELHQSSGLVAGQRGGGKTVILQVINAQVMRCPDALLWQVDLNGGGMAAACSTPYALGEVDQPAADWVATSPAEAIAMGRIALAIAKDRKRRYQQLMIAQNTDVLPVSADLPAIVIVVDEGGEVTGEDASRDAQEAGRLLREVQRIGRAMCVNVIFSVQRATADYVPTQMKKAVSLSICTRVKDDSELAYLFDWGTALSSRDLMYPGCAYLQRGTGVPRLYKGALMLPKQLADIARATARIRPRLDAAAGVIGGEIYAGRWQAPEARTFLDGLAGHQIEAIPIEETTPEPPPMPPALAAAFDQIAAVQRLAAGDFDPLATAEGRRAFLVRLVDEAGPAGIRTHTLVDRLRDAGVTERRQTVSEWLRIEQDAGRVVPLQFGLWTTPGQAARSSEVSDEPAVVAVP